MKPYAIPHPYRANNKAYFYSALFFVFMKHPDADLINLNKYISSTGFCSRREADQLIEQERVTVNGHPVQKGYRVKPGDEVEIDGEPIRKNKKTVYIVCNKPQGITSTTDVRDKTNIITFLNHPQRIFPVGRLDKDSDGLILLTNDGDIVNKILRASNNHEKEYIVVVDKDITPDFVQQMSNGIPILGTRTKKCEVRQEGNKRFRITLTQGLNRQIRRMCEYLGYDVEKLTRIRIMNINLGALPVGHWRYLSAQEMDKMHLLMADSTGEAEEQVAQPKKKKAATPADRPLTEKEKKAQQRKEAFLQRREKESQPAAAAPAEKKATSRAEKARREREKYLKVKKETEQRAENARSKKSKMITDFESASFRDQNLNIEKKESKKTSYKEFRAKSQQKSSGRPAKSAPKPAARPGKSKGKPATGKRGR